MSFDAHTIEKTDTYCEQSFIIKPGLAHLNKG